MTLVLAACGEDTIGVVYDRKRFADKNGELVDAGEADKVHPLNGGSVFVGRAGDVQSSDYDIHVFNRFLSENLESPQVVLEGLIGPQRRRVIQKTYELADEQGLDRGFADLGCALQFAQTLYLFGIAGESALFVSERLSDVRFKQRKYHGFGSGMYDEVWGFMKTSHRPDMEREALLEMLERAGNLSKRMDRAHGHNLLGNLGLGCLTHDGYERIF